METMCGDCNDSSRGSCSCGCESGGCGMEMTFFWSAELKNFFFKALKIDNVGAFLLTCLVFALLSILYEGIKVYTAYARAKVAREQIAAVSCAPSESANLLVTEPNSNFFSGRFFRMINETMVFLFHNTLGYVVMLAVMCYNGWVFLAVVLSMGLGYFFFGHIAIKINMESIQARTRKVVCTPVCSQACAEAGVSGVQNQNTSPCPSAPQMSYSKTVSTCHENQAMSEAKSKNGTCYDEKSSNVNDDVDENCDCRL
ncbi:copper transporter 5.1-like [Contarinia nasturtii]|uniref:copper transporter 5.1-like n=1 Tax=Contarinia nasturtii TaxID=265458 RepID=UPI0012D3FBD1|nr:copper transporter 5.1-like [Contarinia nasturtii]XP_031621415.1 copper transporter 5.1-like [Contarinia nasturtii]XP_031621416.1 copper transporter 5.1-like [Contarinia nasturtii]XP_031621417.1 copper transporter 5.1-like [Contarinia nasturtii]